MKAILKYYVITNPGTFQSFKSKLFNTKLEAENWAEDIKQKTLRELSYKILAKEIM